MNPEAALQRRIILAIDAPDVFVHPNVVGQALHAALARELCPSCRQAAGRHRVTVGLGVGSPDLVGSVGDRALYLEVKTPTGPVRPEQLAWHEAVRSRGAIVSVVRSVDEAVSVVNSLRGG